MTTFNSLLVGGYTPWHDGSGTLTYSFFSGQASSLPNYYRRVDRNGDGVRNSVEILQEDTYIRLDASIGMNASERDFTTRALNAWGEVANLNLEAAAPGQTGDLAIGAALFDDPDLFGFVSDFPGTAGTPSVHGDLWINRANTLQSAAQLGNTGWQTYLHELGHALGLSHPDEDPNNDASDPRNNNQYTVMSYIAHPGQIGVPDEDASWPLTPMLFDIQAIQSLYGANLETRTGSTSYFAGAGAQYALGAGGKISNGRTAVLTVWDAGGIDTFNAQNQTRSVTLNLNNGAFSTIGAIKNNIAIAFAVQSGGVTVNLIENAIGGAAADILIGNAGANRLDGRGGGDRMNGGAGGDIYIVNSAADVVVEVAAVGIDHVLSSVSYSLVGRHVENMTLTGTLAINAIGNNLNNVITGNGAANRIDGGIGADRMIGGNGADLYIVNHAGDIVVETSGAGGIDRVLSSVSYSLIGRLVEHMTLTGTGAINGIGNALANDLTGNGAANQLNGGLGNDYLIGGGGADRFVFNTALNQSTNVDELADYSVAADTIMLDRAIFRAIGANGTLAPGAFRVGTAALDGNDRIVFDSAAGELYYDRDGSGAAAAILFAFIEPRTALTSADFLAYGG